MHRKMDKNTRKSWYESPLLQNNVQYSKRCTDFRTLLSQKVLVFRKKTNRKYSCSF